MTLMFNPQLALVLAVTTAAWLGLGWLTGRDRGLCRAGRLAGVADIGIGLASGRLLLVAAGVLILAIWLPWGGRAS